MDARELQIGDIVMYCPNGSRWYVRLSSITKNMCRTDENGLVRIENLKPIPLTREMLELNGFSWIEDEDELSDSEYDGYMVLYSDEEIRCYMRGSMDRYFLIEIGDMDSTYIRLNTNYIHELQHALRIAGLKELADNFKI